MKQQLASKGIITLICLLFVTACTLAQQIWRVGDQVEAKHTNNWYNATIEEVGRGQYKIHYDGYDHSYDLWKTPADIRPRANQAGTASQGNAATWVLANRGATSWHAARLLSKEQNQYKVRYHGDPLTSYYLVPPDRIRPMPPQSIPATDASFFTGRWELSIWGGVTYAAGKAPPLTIKADGTYEWIVPANGGRSVITGRWRNVTAAEWRYDSIAIVLLNGVHGKPWIVSEDITYCTPKFVGEKPSWCTPDKVRDAIKLWDGDVNYAGSRMK